jgi:hypothetical protein
MNEEKIKGKREMLWNMQKQFQALKTKGKEFNEENVNNIIKSLCQLQQIEEMSWEIQYYDDIEGDFYRGSIQMLKSLGSGEKNE